MVFNEKGNLRKGDLSRAKTLPKSNSRTGILLWGPGWNREPQGCGQAGKQVFSRWGAWSRNSVELPFICLHRGRETSHADKCPCMF